MKESLLRLLLIVWLLFPIGSTAEPSFRQIFIFGDSLSDTGNLASLPEFGFLNNLPFDRGFSNGPRAVEVLASSIGLDIDPSLYLVGPPVGTSFSCLGRPSQRNQPHRSAGSNRDLPVKQWGHGFRCALRRVHRR
jgi:hypothetical protein